jgi:glycosyltransferase involved in cell wall biosynthesis
MPLNVAFFSDALTSSGYGLGRYASELLRALGQVAPEIKLRSVSAHVEVDADRTTSETPSAHNPRARQCSVRLPYRRKIVAGLWTSLGLPRLEHWIPWADLVHCVELDYRIATRKPLIVTIHDIGPLTHPELFRKSHPWLLKIALNSVIQRAAAIICVSRTTADAVESYTKCRLGDRLTIIPEGVSEEFFQSGDLKPVAKPGDSLTHGAPYFLWAGSLNPRKNLSRVIDSFEQVASRIPHHLVLTGGLGWGSEETLRRIRSSVAAQRIHLPGRVSDAELRSLYRQATAFVYVSLMEGFGLPILEAMTCGCPVITSNISSMPEVAGDAAFLVDPIDTNEIAEAMYCLATDSTFSKQLSTKGRSRAEDFRWDSCAVAVAEIYKRVAKTSGRIRSPLDSSGVRHPQPALLQGTEGNEQKELCSQSNLWQR